MKKNDLLGYLLGLLIFVFLLPAGMWLISGKVHPGWFQVICFVLLAVTGIGLSVRTIVYIEYHVSSNHSLVPFGSKDSILSIL